MNAVALLIMAPMLFAGQTVAMGSPAAPLAPAASDSLVPCHVCNLGCHAHACGLSKKGVIELAGCHCWLVQQCFTVEIPTALLDKPAVAPFFPPIPFVDMFIGNISMATQAWPWHPSRILNGNNALAAIPESPPEAAAADDNPNAETPITKLTAALAAAGANDPDVVAGRDALDQYWPQGYPWYDSETDGVRRIEIPETRDFSWLSEMPGDAWNWFKGLIPEGFRAWLSDTWSGFWSMVGDFWDWIWSWPRTPVAWGVRIVFFLAVGLILYLAVRRIAGVWWDASTDADSADGSAVDPGDESRIEALPFPVRRGNLDLLGEARACYERGDYRQAIVYLFSFQLVRLDRQQIIRLTKGKTNRQYLREVGPRRALARLVGQTMIAFEDVFFGNRALDRARFESCWSRLDEFESLATEEAG